MPVLLEHARTHSGIQMQTDHKFELHKHTKQNMKRLEIISNRLDLVVQINSRL